MAEEADRNTEPEADRSPRRPYQTPRLQRLGTLTELTAAVGSLNRNDHAGGHAPLTKTS